MKFGHVENMHFLSALLAAWSAGTAWLPLLWPLLHFGPMPSPGWLNWLGFCITAQQSGCVTKSSISNDIPNGLRISELFTMLKTLRSEKCLKSEGYQLHLNVSHSYCWWIKACWACKKNLNMHRLSCENLRLIRQCTPEITHVSKLRWSVVHPVCESLICSVQG